MVVIMFLVSVLLISNVVLLAEVKTEEKSEFKLEGMMGRMMGMFGGKAAKEGTISTVAVKENRKMTANQYAGEIIDLDEQKVYSLDMKKKNYEVVTFQEMRRRMQQTREEAADAAREETEQEPEPSEKEMEFDFSLKESGQKRSINGYDCHEVIMVITGREKGKTLEEGGGMVMTSHIWIGPDIPALKEISEFDQRYAKAMEWPIGLGGSAEQMAMAMAMYPTMKDMIGKMEAEQVNMEGAQILTEMVMETVRSPQEMAEESDQEPEPSSIRSIGGIGGMLGGRLSRKKESETDKPKNRTTIVTLTQELLKVSTSVSPADLSIPAGFKEKK